MTYRTIDTAQFQPVTPANQPVPILDWVAIDKMVIDTRYQRPLDRGNITAITAIAAAFTWSRFSPVVVAPVEGGKFAIIDGQHRVHAAAVCGFESVPAMITTCSPIEQAKAFIDINTRQIRVSAYQVYKASLQANDPIALRMRDAVEAGGGRLMTSPGSTATKKAGQIYAIQLIRQLVTAGHHNAVTVTIRALLDYDSTSAANFDHVLMTPLMWAVAKNPAFHNPALILTALHEKKPWLVIDAANRLSSAEGIAIATARRDAFTTLLRMAARKGAAA